MELKDLYRASMKSFAHLLRRNYESEVNAQDIATADDLEWALLRIREDLRLGGHVGFRMVVQGRSRALDPLIRNEACEIGREALLNAFRHSEASEVEVEVEYAPRGLRIAVRDNGKGITAEQFRSQGHRGLSGILNLAERMGAELKLLSRVAAGTEVELSIPARIAFSSQTSVRRLECAQA